MSRKFPSFHNFNFKSKRPKTRSSTFFPACEAQSSENLPALKFTGKTKTKPHRSKGLMKAIGLQKKQRPVESRDASMRIENPQQINQERANP